MTHAVNLGISIMLNIFTQTEIMQTTKKPRQWTNPWQHLFFRNSLRNFRTLLVARIPFLNMIDTLMCPSVRLQFRVSRYKAKRSCEDITCIKLGCGTRTLQGLSIRKGPNGRRVIAETVLTIQTRTNRASSDVTIIL